jgi:alpha-1,6-mannosyltransferase
VKAEYRAAVWLSAIVALAVAGSALASGQAATQNFYDAYTHTPYSVAYRFPIHVVQAASPGWNVLLLVWAMLAGIAFAGVRLVKALSDIRGVPAIALVVAFLVAGAALSTFAIAQSSDIYFYVLYGRLYGLYGINPYSLGAPLPVASDPLISQLLPFTNNPPFSDPYGPLWTLCAGLQSKILGSASLFWSAWAFRAVAVAAAAASVAGLLYMQRLRPAAERMRSVGAFAFHPLVLYEAAVGGHNDALMVAPALWAFAIVDELPLVAGLLLGAAVAIKYVAVIALPFLVVRAWRGGSAGAVLTAVLAIIIPLLCAHPFQTGAAGSQALASNGSRFAMSLEWLVNMPIFAAGLGNVPALGLPSLPFVGVLSWPRILQLAGLATVALLAAYGAWRALRESDAKHLWRPVVALLVGLPSMHPWYALWIAPAIACGGRWAAYAWWFGIFVLGCYTVDAVSADAMPAWVPIGATVAYLTVPVLIARFSPQPAESAA